MNKLNFREKFDNDKPVSIELKALFDCIEGKISYFTLSDRYAITCDKKHRFVKKMISYSDLPEYKAFNNSLKPNKVCSFATFQWLFNDSPLSISEYENAKESPVLVSVYLFNEDTKHILLTTVKNLLMLDDKANTMTVPQDLSFFREDGTIIIGSISHESMVGCSLREDELNIVEKFPIFEPDEDEDYSMPKLNLRYMQRQSDLHIT